MIVINAQLRHARQPQITSNCHSRDHQVSNEVLDRHDSRQCLLLVAELAQSQFWRAWPASRTLLPLFYPVSPTSWLTLGWGTLG